MFALIAGASFLLQAAAAGLASLIAFGALRVELLLIAVPAAAVTAGVLGFCAWLALTRLKREQRQLERLATVDELTSAPNRRVFLERLEEEVDRAARLDTALSVIFIDIDQFKRINDDHGHQVGDEVLKAIYARLEERLRTYDFVGRFGGDEFVMALPGTNGEDGAAVAERLRESVQGNALGRLPGVTISLGIAELDKGMGADELLHNADTALYRAKNAGRNRTERYLTGG
jgi:two-component system cell cycle response regulator